MEIFYTILFFVFGLVFGSFYNVVGLRLCKGESLISPPSHCVKCNHKLSPLELIPVFSYIFLKGKCKKCHEKISIMYPIIELITGTLFALSFYCFGFSNELILALLLSSLFVIVIVTDLNYYIILDSVLVVFGVLVFAYNIVTKGFMDACTYVLFGFIMFLFMFLLMKLGNVLFKEECLGGGDIKLLGVLGMTFSVFMSFISLSVGALLALPSSLYFYFKKKDKIVPFGPFIIAGFLIMLFMQTNSREIIDFFTFL